MSKPIKLICGQTNFDKKNSQKVWVKRSFWSKTALSLKDFGVKKNFGQKKMLVKKNFWVEIFFGQKYFWFKKSFGKKLIFIPKNFGSK